MRRVAARLLADSLAGDHIATGLLLAYVIGKPQPAADPDRVDVDELQLLLSTPSKNEVFAKALDALPGDQLARIARNLLDHRQDGEILEPADNRRIGALRRKALADLLGDEYDRLDSLSRNPGARPAEPVEPPPPPPRDDSATVSLADVMPWAELRQISGFSDKQLKVAIVTGDFPQPINLDGLSADTDLLFLRKDVNAWLAGKSQPSRK
jgi:predicted DNA-binding transcriptional regulator AlpA